MSHFTQRFISTFSGLMVIYLILPIVVIIPLSFNTLPYFTYNKAMLSLHPDAFSTRWYLELFHSYEWRRALINSLTIAIPATMIAVILGTLASFSLNNPLMPMKRLFMRLFLAPLVTPIILVSVGLFFFFSEIQQSWLGEWILALTGRYERITITLAHAALGTPYVVVLVSTSLNNVQPSWFCAAKSLGASSIRAFFSVVLPNIMPGILSGSLLAFITSLDELVIVLMLGGPHDQTLSHKMFSGLREEMNPTLLAIATLMITLSVVVLLISTALVARQAKSRTER